jgi:hypothetical protein
MKPIKLVKVMEGIFRSEDGFYRICRGTGAAARLWRVYFTTTDGDHRRETFGSFASARDAIRSGRIWNS